MPLCHTCHGLVHDIRMTKLGTLIKEALAAKALEAKRTGNGWRCGRPCRISGEVIASIHTLRAQGNTMRQIAAKTN